MGKIVDISTGGMGFEYTSFREQRLQTPAMQNIFVNKKNFYLNEIPGKIVSDTRISEENSSDNF